MIPHSDVADQRSQERRAWPGERLATRRRTCNYLPYLRHTKCPSGADHRISPDAGATRVPIVRRRTPGSSSEAGVVGTSAETLPFMGREHSSGDRAVVLLWLFQSAECAGEEDERVFDGRGAQVDDAPYDDPVVAGGMLGDDLTFEGGECVG
jgi:hypothetical protein